MHISQTIVPIFYLFDYLALFNFLSRLHRNTKHLSVDKLQTSDLYHIRILLFLYYWVALVETMCLLVGPFEELNQISKGGRLGKVRRIIKVIKLIDFPFGDHKEFLNLLFFEMRAIVLEYVEKRSDFGEGLLFAIALEHFLLSNNNYSLVPNIRKHLYFDHI